MSNSYKRLKFYNKDGEEGVINKFSEIDRCSILDVKRLRCILRDNGFSASYVDIYNAWEDYSAVEMCAGWLDLPNEDEECLKCILTRLTEVDRRRVVCAANRWKHVIVPSARHFDSLMHELISLLPLSLSPGKWEQGFIDQFGVFMTREEAWKVAEANGQILHQVSEPGILYSENLY